MVWAGVPRREERSRVVTFGKPPSRHPADRNWRLQPHRHDQHGAQPRAVGHAAIGAWPRADALGWHLYAVERHFGDVAVGAWLPDRTRYTRPRLLEHSRLCPDANLRLAAVGARQADWPPRQRVRRPNASVGHASVATGQAHCAHGQRLHRKGSRVWHAAVADRPPHRALADARPGLDAHLGLPPLADRQAERAVVVPVPRLHGALGDDPDRGGRPRKPRRRHRAPLHGHLRHRPL